MNRHTVIFMVVMGFLPFMKGSEQGGAVEQAPTESIKQPVVTGQGPSKKKLLKDSKAQEEKKALHDRLTASVAKEISYLCKNRSAFIQFSKEPFMCAALSRKGNYYALGSKKGTVISGDAKTGKEQGIFSGHKAAVSWITFSPDGTKILTCSMDMTAKLWDRSTRKLEHTLSGHKGILFTGSFSPDGTRIVTGSADRTVKVWDAGTGKLISTVPLGFCVDAVSFSDEGASLYATSLNGSAKKWKSTGGEQEDSVRGPQGPLAVSEFSHDGTRVFSGTFIGTVIEWNPRTGKVLRTTTLGEHLKVFALALCGKARKILAGCSDGTGRLIDSASGKEIMRLIGTKQSLQSVALSGDAQRALTVSYEGTARLYDLSLDVIKRLQATLTDEQAAFLKEAYQARLKGTPLAVISRAQCAVLVSFDEPAVSYLKDAFLLYVDPSSERAAIHAKKDILE